MSSWTLCLVVALAVVVSAQKEVLPVARETPAASAAPIALAIPSAPAVAVVDPAPYLVCNSCGRFNGLISALLLAVYSLLFALLGNVNTALCYTLHFVYILLCIIQVTVATEISIAISGVIIILQTVGALPVLGGLLQTIGLLLTGLLGCLLRILGIVLIL